MSEAMIFGNNTILVRNDNTDWVSNIIHLLLLLLIVVGIAPLYYLEPDATLHSRSYHS